MTELKPVTYRFSSLARGFLLFWRGWAVMIPLVLITAGVQSLLFSNPIAPRDSWLNVLAAVVSALIGVVGAVLVTAASVALVRGHRGARLWVATFTPLRHHWLSIKLWSVALAALVVAGFVLSLPLGIAVIAMTPFVLVGAVAEERNPFAFNFVMLGRRFWRWLVTVLIGLAFATIGYLVGGFVDFFLRGVLGAFALWVAVGFFFSWFTVAFALIGLSVRREASAASATLNP